MKIYLSIFVLSAILSSCAESEDITPTPETKEIGVENALTYDSILAEELGADEYGMHPYVMAFLKMGPNRPTDPKIADSLQTAHLNNITRMAEEGSLVMAGPFLDNDSIRGIYIFNVETIEEARILTETDPAIQYGSLVMELRPWYGSAALIQMNDLHKKIAKINI